MLNEDTLFPTTDVGHAKVEELHQQPAVSEDSSESIGNSGLVKNLMNEDDMKASYALDPPVCIFCFYYSF